MKKDNLLPRNGCNGRLGSTVRVSQDYAIGKPIFQTYYKPLPTLKKSKGWTKLKFQN
jgi:hypothetical protein